MVRHLRHLFTPHHTNNHRPRILHPTGLVVVILVFGLYASLIQLSKYLLATNPQGYVLGFASNIFPDQVISQTNAERAKAGLGALTLNDKLNQAAAAKANHMFANNYWAHIAPDGTTPWVFIQNAGYRYSVAGENLARDFGDTGSMLSAWMNSPSHRDNIMNPKYTQIGVAVVNGVLQGSETTLVVQMFGNPTGDFPKTTNLAAATTRAPTRTPTKAPTAGTGAVARVIPSITPQAAATVQPTPEITTIPANLAALQPAATMPTLSSFSSFKMIFMSPLTLTKTIGVAVILMLTIVLLYDEYHAHKHKIPRRVSKNWAHIVFLAIALFMLISITAGRVTQPKSQPEYTVMGTYDSGH